MQRRPGAIWLRDLGEAAEARVEDYDDCSQRRPEALWRMYGSDTDLKNIELSKLIYQLRQALDVYRIIGLNVDRIIHRGLGQAFFGTAQQQAHLIVAVTTCKIYEWEKDFELNSIPGIIRGLPKAGYTDAQLKQVERFGKKYGHRGPCIELPGFIDETREIFRAGHVDALLALREFRNKYAAHSEAGYVLQPLASHDTFEALFQFANDFYSVVADVIVGASPALMSVTAGPSLIKVLKELGVENPQFDFPPATA